MDFLKGLELSEMISTARAAEYALPLGNALNQFLDQTNLLCDVKMCNRAKVFFH